MATISQVASPSSSSSSSNLPSKLESLTLEETSINNNNFAPCLQLPDNLTEKILERLPISDYVRFGAVCPQWRSIQESHRRRHTPSAPPMLSLPWFIPCEPQQEPVDCFSPFEQRSHRIRLPLSRRYLKRGIESKGRSWCSYLPNGLLVLDDVPWNRCFYFSLLNPFSGVQIKLPREGYWLYNMSCKLSVSPPPGWLVFLMAEDMWTNRIRLFREGDDFWTELEFPDQNLQWGCPLELTSAIVWEGKVYYLFLGRDLMVIDPLPTDPTIQFLEMDQSQLPVVWCGWGNQFHSMELFMVGSNGKMLLVVEFFESDFGCDVDTAGVGFQVFEADFSIKRWVRLESLGDRVLFIHQKFICSMLADDIGVEGNCIYCLDPSKIKESYRQNSSRVGPIPWSVFNLGTGKLTESPLPHVPTPYTHRMFVPSLC